MYQSTTAKRYLRTRVFFGGALCVFAVAVQQQTFAQDTYVELGRTIFGGSEYLLVGLGTTPETATTMNPFQARDAAEDFNGWLMSVGSLEENNTVAETLAPFRNEPGNFWIGFTDRSIEEDPIYGVEGASEGNINTAPDNVLAGWKWSTGEPVTFTNWNMPSPGVFSEPNDVGAGEDWAEIWHIDDPSDPTYLQWNDEKDNKNNWAIVEREAVPPPLVLEINPDTGNVYLSTTFSSDDTVSVTLNDLQFRPNDANFRFDCLEQYESLGPAS